MESRNLGYLEASFQTESLVVVTVGEVQTTTRAIPDEAIQRAVDMCTQRHPHLRMNIDRAASPLRWKPLPAPHDRITVKFVPASNPDHWKQITDDEMNEEFAMGTDTPLWKVTVVRQPSVTHLLVAFHHCMGDGTSGLVLVHDILRFALVGGDGAVASSPLPMLHDAEALAFADSAPDPKRLRELSDKLLSCPTASSGHRPSRASSRVPETTRTPLSISTEPPPRSARSRPSVRLKG